MNLSIENNRIFLSFKFDWDTVDRIRSMKIMTWDKNKKRWHCTDNAVNRNIIAKHLPESGLKISDIDSETKNIRY